MLVDALAGAKLKDLAPLGVTDAQDALQHEHRGSLRVLVQLRVVGGVRRPLRAQIDHVQRLYRHALVEDRPSHLLLAAHATRQRLDGVVLETFFLSRVLGDHTQEGARGHLHRVAEGHRSHSHVVLVLRAEHDELTEHRDAFVLVFMGVPLTDKLLRHRDAPDDDDHACVLVSSNGQRLTGHVAPDSTRPRQVLQEFGRATHEEHHAREDTPEHSLGRNAVLLVDREAIHLTEGSQDALPEPLLDDDQDQRNGRSATHQGALGVRYTDKCPAAKSHAFPEQRELAIFRRLRDAIAVLHDIQCPGNEVGIVASRLDDLPSNEDHALTIIRDPGCELLPTFCEDVRLEQGFHSLRHAVLHERAHLPEAMFDAGRHARVAPQHAPQ
mmetsp:Transcript_133723/g.387142  ORF Transcript_133723/g.387142 Transcript_133723/m.387142 type:complete len:383 (-) Transcript_133723:152-1300(-)